VLKHPLSEEFGGDYPIALYVDDTLLIVPANARVVFNPKGLLRSFSDSSCLHVNFHKSFLVPIDLTAIKASPLVSTFGCNLGNMPFTYLGLPLGTTRPTIQEFNTLMSRIESRLNGISMLLLYQGRLILVNFVFSAMPSFYMSSLQTPPHIFKQIDKYRKHYICGVCVWGHQ